MGYCNIKAVLWCGKDWSGCIAGYKSSFEWWGLTISGVMSENSDAEGITYLVVYDKYNRLLDLKTITELDQSKFNVPIENMKDWHTVKFLRWEISSLRPLHNAVEVCVKKE